MLKEEGQFILRRCLAKRSEEFGGIKCFEFRAIGKGLAASSEIAWLLILNSPIRFNAASVILREHAKAIALLMGDGK